MSGGGGILALLAAGVLLAGCSDGPASPDPHAPDPHAPVAHPRLVVLAVDFGPEPTRGPIQGAVRCGANDPPVALCLPDDVPLAEAVLACGPEQVTIDRGTSHRRIVHFPAGQNQRFAAMPADLDIVRCVRQRVGFPFTAGLAAGPSELSDLDERPFASLHSAGRPRREGSRATLGHRSIRRR